MHERLAQVKIVVHILLRIDSGAGSGTSLLLRWRLRRASNNPGWRCRADLTTLNDTAAALALHFDRASIRTVSAREAAFLLQSRIELARQLRLDMRLLTLGLHAHLLLKILDAQSRVHVRVDIPDDVQGPSRHQATLRTRKVDILKYALQKLDSSGHLLRAQARQLREIDLI